MKHSTIWLCFIACLCAVILLHTTTTTLFVDALPTKTVGPYVHYVDDITLPSYIDNNSNQLTYLYIYSHQFMCVRCQPVGDVLSKVAKEFSGQINVLAMDSKDIYNLQTMQRFGIDSEKHINYPVVLEFPLDQEVKEHLLSEAKAQNKTTTTLATLPGNIIDISTIEYDTFRQHILDRIEVYGTVKHLDSTNMKDLLKFTRKVITTKKNPTETTTITNGDDGDVVENETNVIQTLSQYGTPKAILLTTKPAVPSIWSSLSYQLGDKMEFYIAQKSDGQLFKRFKSFLPSSQTYPVILVLRQDEYNIDLPDDEVEPVVFNGLLKAPLIKAFLSLYTPLQLTRTQARITLADPTKGEKHDQIELLTQEESIQMLYHHIINTQNTFVPVFTDQKCFEHFATNWALDEYTTAMTTVDNSNIASSSTKTSQDNTDVINNGLIVMLFLPRITEHTISLSKIQELNYFIEIHKAIQEMKSDIGYTFGIIPATVLPGTKYAMTEEELQKKTISPLGLEKDNILRAFGLQQQDYPQLVIYAPRKAGYNAFMGSFDVKNILQWLQDVTIGRKTLNPISSRIIGGADVQIDTFLTQSFYNTKASRCDALIQRKIQNKEELEKLLNQQNDAQRDVEDELRNAGIRKINTAESPYTEHRWYKPQRPLTKKGQLIKMDDYYFYNTYIQRSIPALILFMSPPPAPEKGEKLAKHDFYTFKQTVEGLNGLVEGYYVECNSASKKLRKLFGINKNDCTGSIYHIPAKATYMSTEGTKYDEYYNATTIEMGIKTHRSYFEVDAKEYKSPTRTFSIETLRNFALEKSYSTVEMPAKLGYAANAFQNFLLESVDEPKVLIFTKKMSMNLPKALSVEFWSYAQIAMVDDGHDSLVHQLQITEFPSVRILVPYVQSAPGATNGEKSMKLDIIPISKNQLYYNAIAAHLDTVVSKRYVGVEKQVGSVYEPLKNEHPVDTMFRKHYEEKERERKRKAGIHDEL